MNCRTKEGKEVYQNTIKSYAYAIYRGFNFLVYKIDRFNDSVFTCKSNSLESVLENKARKLKSSGVHTESQNVLSRDDVLKLYQSKSL